MSSNYGGLVSLSVKGCPVPLLQTSAKALRARVIAEHLLNVGREVGVVCFSSGNAARELQSVGLRVTWVGAGGSLTPARWWQPWEVAEAFPGMFDATSGHLPTHLMADLAQALVEDVGHLMERRGSEPWLVPTGSGETLLALSMAFPSATLWPLVNICSHTAFHEKMPLARFVTSHAEMIDAQSTVVEG